MYVPSIIGGFSGSASGVTYERYALREGSIVVRITASASEGSSSSSSSSATGNGNGTSAATAAGSGGASAPPPLAFKPEEEIGEEELESCIDWKAMGIITRMNPSSTDVEVCLADGVTREKVSVLVLRAAGAMEQRTFRKLQSRFQQQQQQQQQQGVKRPRELADSLALLPLPCDEPWWVFKGIVVRVVNDALPLLCGRKFVVANASKKENRILLADFTEGGKGAGSGPMTGGHAVQQQDVETVVPKEGGKALVLLGDHRGEVITVTGKVRAAETREIVGVVGTTSAGVSITVQPDQLSQFA
jgi:hypothetical protein